MKDAPKDTDHDAPADEHGNAEKDLDELHGIAEELGVANYESMEPDELRSLLARLEKGENKG